MVRQIADFISGTITAQMQSCEGFQPGRKVREVESAKVQQAESEQSGIKSHVLRDLIGWNVCQTSSEIGSP